MDWFNLDQGHGRSWLRHVLKEQSLELVISGCWQGMFLIFFSLLWRVSGTAVVDTPHCLVQMPGTSSYRAHVCTLLWLCDSCVGQELHAAALWTEIAVTIRAEALSAETTVKGKGFLSRSACTSCYDLQLLLGTCCFIFLLTVMVWTGNIYFQYFSQILIKYDKINTR